MMTAWFDDILPLGVADWREGEIIACDDKEGRHKPGSKGLKKVAKGLDSEKDKEGASSGFLLHHFRYPSSLNTLLSHTA